ncbi:MAG TPA: hypothetical protein VGB46_02280 [Flavisolibacter sp.]|jgi:hypothetical protein
MGPAVQQHPSSYRDPSGFLFYYQGQLFRQVNEVFREDFEQFMNGGLYQSLTSKGLLVPHQTIERNLTGSEDWLATLRPETVPLISYPYEWCFDMWKDAALTTLEAAQEAMSHKMMLKDASAYNVQWHLGRMRFIDTLSFERYREDSPWIAYRQFCEHFLAPLALMHYSKLPLSPLFLAYPDGLPLGMAAKLLPYRSKWNLNAYLHIHLHARLSAGKGDKRQPATEGFSRQKLKNIFRSLGEMVRSFSLKGRTGVWSGYYDEAAQRDDYLSRKKEIIEGWLKKGNYSSAIDAGANEGEFSLLAARLNMHTISCDLDHYSVNNLYNKIKEQQVTNLHPLVMDLSHPSPAIGVNNVERSSFASRVNADVVLALALVHHLAIGRNIPFQSIAELFRSLGQDLIIEYIPKEDEKIKLMLAQKQDIYSWYHREAFLNGFSKYFSVADEQPVGTSGRVLFLMRGPQSTVYSPQT